MLFSIIFISTPITKICFLSTNSDFLFSKPFGEVYVLPSKISNRQFPKIYKKLENSYYQLIVVMKFDIVDRVEEVMNMFHLLHF